MNAFILGLLLILTIPTASADVCFGGSMRGSGYCAQTVIEKGSTTVLKGLYIDVGNSIRIGIKKSWRKTLCEVMKFKDIVAGSAVVEKQESLVLKDDRLVPGKLKVITEIECVNP